MNSEHNSGGKGANLNLRLFGLMIMLILFGLIIVIRLGMIMLGGSSSNQQDGVPIERGSILDRNGRILAIQLNFDAVTAWTPNIKNPAEVAQLLAPIIDKDQIELQQQIEQKDGFTILKRQTTLTESNQIRALMSAGRVSGISLQQSTGRIYPEKELAAAIIGYAGVDNVGLAGIEYNFDQKLMSSAEQGGSRLYGNHVILTLDLNIQYFAHQLARQALNEEEAEKVLILVMNSQNGELVAAATEPSFDPNNFEQYSPERRKNHIISTIYEPGSVFKIFSIAALLEEERITTNTLFNTSLGYSGASEQYEITDVGEYGTIDVGGIIQFSSNIGAALASDRIQNKELYLYLHALGFGKKTGILLAGEEQGIFRDHTEWTPRTKPTISIGQEVGVTAIQMITAASAIANEGVLIQPQIVQEVVSANGTQLINYSRKEQQRVFSVNTARQILQYMQQATQSPGTARRVVVEGVDIAAKTGTAEVYDTESGSYSDTHFIASTLAIFPVKNPQYIIYVVVDYPKKESVYGGVVAAPLAREIIEYLVSYSGIEGNTIASISTQPETQPRALPSFDTHIPNLIGYSKRELLPLVNNAYFKVQMEGSGWVVRQFPDPGTAIDSGTILYLELK